MTAGTLTETGVSPAVFRSAMAALAAPVTIITCYDEQGVPRGMTVSAVCSLSLDPPLILVCLDRRSRSHQALTGAGSFCVNVLAPGDEALARRFAGPAEQRFADVALVPGRAPGLADATLRWECEHYEARPGGDHTLLVGRVTAVRGEPAASGGLVHHQREFARVLRSPQG